MALSASLIMVFTIFLLSGILLPGHGGGANREHAKSWGACVFLNAKLRAFGKEKALWGSWFGG
jgi:hypothetical protein